MPVISKVNVGFQGQKFIRIMKINSEGVFSCNLPDPVAKDLGKTDATGHSKDEAEQNWKKLVTKWAETTKVVRRVICYEVETEERFQHKGVQISIIADVYDETTLVDAEGGETYTYEKVSSQIEHWPRDLGGIYFASRPLKEREKDSVEFNEATLQLFIDLAEGMDKLADKIATLFDDKENLLGYKSSGQFLLTKGGE